VPIQVRISMGIVLIVVKNIKNLKMFVQISMIGYHVKITMMNVQNVIQITHMIRDTACNYFTTSNIFCLAMINMLTNPPNWTSSEIISIKLFSISAIFFRI